MSFLLRGCSEKIHRDPAIQVMPALALNLVKVADIGLFGSLGNDAEVSYNSPTLLKP